MRLQAGLGLTRVTSEARRTSGGGGGRGGGGVVDGRTLPAGLPLPCIHVFPPSTRSSGNDVARPLQPAPAHTNFNHVVFGGGDIPQQRMNDMHRHRHCRR